MQLQKQAMRKNVLYYTRIVILISCTELPSEKSSSNAVSVMMRCQEIFNINGFLFQPYLPLYKPISASWAYKWELLSINNFVIPEKRRT